jgi:hypothetical protein
MKLPFLLLFLLILTGNAYAQTKIPIYIGDIEGPDSFACERYRMLLMEELGKLRGIELVTDINNAQAVLSGAGQYEISQSSSGGGLFPLAGPRGWDPVADAVLSIKLVDRNTGKILFEGDCRKHAKSIAGVAQGMVFRIVSAIKYKLKWK